MNTNLISRLILHKSNQVNRDLNKVSSGDKVILIKGKEEQKEDTKVEDLLENKL